MGITDRDGEGGAVFPLPPAGFDVTVACYVGQDGLTWLHVATGGITSANPYGCGFVLTSSGLVAAVLGVPPGWRYYIVAIYHG